MSGYELIETLKRLSFDELHGQVVIAPTGAAAP